MDVLRLMRNAGKILGLLNYLELAVRLARVLIDSLRGDYPEPKDRYEEIVVGAVKLYRDFEGKHDTNKDGRSDWTREEVIEFAVNLLNYVRNVLQSPTAPAS